MSFTEAIRRNRARLEKLFAEADPQATRFLAECRDLGDTHDEDAGVYFVRLRDEAAVTELLTTRLVPDNHYDKLLAIYDLTQPLAGQGPGQKRDEWLARVAEETTSES